MVLGIRFLKRTANNITVKPMNVKEFDDFFGDQLAIFLFSVQIPSKIVDSVFPPKMLNSAILTVFRPKPFRSVLINI